MEQHEKDEIRAWAMDEGAAAGRIAARSVDAMIGTSSEYGTRRKPQVLRIFAASYVQAYATAFRRAIREAISERRDVAANEQIQARKARRERKEPTNG